MARNIWLATGAMLLWACVGGNDPTAGGGPGSGVDGKADTADEGSAPLLACTQRSEAGEELGSLTVVDQGVADEVPDDLSPELDEQIVHEGIPVHQYRLQGTYVVEDRAPAELDAAYFGHLFEPDGSVYSNEDAYSLKWMGESKAILVVRVEQGVYENVGLECEGSLPSVEELRPVFETTSFSCRTLTPEDGQTATIEFQVRSLDDPETMDQVWPEGDEASPIAVAPESSLAHTLVDGMANGYLEHQEGRIRIWSDQAGCEFGTLILYEDSGYEQGYFRFESGLGDPGFYTEIECTLSSAE
jgi:hypothetical protein